MNGEFGQLETWREITLCNTALFHSLEQLDRFAALMKQVLRNHRFLLVRREGDFQATSVLCGMGLLSAAPRFRVDLFGKGRTIVRAGYGWYYERLIQIQFTAAANPAITALNPEVENARTDRWNITIVSFGRYELFAELLAVGEKTPPGLSAY